MRLVFVSSEVTPFSKSGGLADVSFALPTALASRGHEVRVVSPLYTSVDRSLTRQVGVPVTLTFPCGSVEIRFHSHERDGVQFVFVEADQLFERDGYYGERGADYSDNALRFAAFTMASLSAAQHFNWQPQIFHFNDWQTGLGPLALKTGFSKAFTVGGAASVFTIHNLAYQGNFAKQTMELLGLPWHLFTIDGVEYWDQLSYMKAALRFADAISTVSPTYAKEILTPGAGAGFDGLLRQRSSDLYGILNGVDTREWNPSTDPYLPATFNETDRSGRAACRASLLSRFGLEQPASGFPLFGIVGRMVEQKGADLTQAVLPPFLEQGACAVVLGSGPALMESGWRSLAARFPRRLAVCTQFDDALAHLIEAAADFFLMPSRFEPCGLNQMYSQIYGAVPIVSSVGGLVDTVRDLADSEGTGIRFSPVSLEAYRSALFRALTLFRDPSAYERVQRRAMRQNFSWAHSAGQYERLYERLAHRA